MNDNEKSTSLQSKLNRRLAIGAVVFLVLIGLWLWPRPQPAAIKSINNFNDCIDAGYPVQESFPPVCSTPDGRSFTKDVGAVAPPPKNLEVTLLVSVTSGGAIPDLKERVARTQAEYQKLWYESHASIKPFPPILPVDFKKQMVLAVYMGPQNSGGHSIQILSVGEYDDRVEVTVKKRSPGTGCVVTQAITSPYQIVAVSKVDKPVNFEIQNESKDCK
jgi:hypothetical protein